MQFCIWKSAQATGCLHMQKWMEQLKMSGPKKVILRSSYTMEHHMNKRDRCDYMVIHVTNKFESFSPQQTCLLHTQGVTYIFMKLVTSDLGGLM